MHVIDCSQFAGFSECMTTKFFQPPAKHHNSAKDEKSRTSEWRVYNKWLFSPWSSFHPCKISLFSTNSRLSNVVVQLIQSAVQVKKDFRAFIGSSKYPAFLRRRNVFFNETLPKYWIKTVKKLGPYIPTLLALCVTILSGIINTLVFLVSA